MRVGLSRLGTTTQQARQRRSRATVSRICFFRGRPVQCPPDVRGGIDVGEPSQGLRCDIAEAANVGTGRCALLPDMDVMNCQSLAVPNDVMHHVVSIESSFNPYAIGV